MKPLVLSQAPKLSVEEAWELVLHLAERAQTGRPLSERCAVTLTRGHDPEFFPNEPGALVLDAALPSGFECRFELSPEAQQLLALYLPLCLGVAASTLKLGHLGQSLDGQIATLEGASQFVTGPEDVLHTHRLRALCDAVIVGRGTVRADDPQLTTRLTPGPNPVRVVIDPELRLAPDRQLFCDSEARTLIICKASARPNRVALGHATVIPVEDQNSQLQAHRIVEVLRSEGLSRLLIEGGGVTLSHFLEAKVLTRLHLTISPVFLGKGRPGLHLPAVSQLSHALRPRTRRFILGEDVLFDCSLSDS